MLSVQLNVDDYENWWEKTHRMNIFQSNPQGTKYTATCLPSRKLSKLDELGHCWRSKDEVIRDVLLWTPAYGQAKAGRPARTYNQQLCEDTGCSPEELPEAMNEREKLRERVRDIRTSDTTWWWWWWWNKGKLKVNSDISVIYPSSSATDKFNLNIQRSQMKKRSRKYRVACQ